jgi:hypothetical protein
MRRSTRVGLSCVAAAALAMAAFYVGSIVLSTDQARGSVSALASLRPSQRGLPASGLPAPVSHLLAGAEAQYGGSASEIQAPITGGATVYSAHVGSDQVCLFIAAQGAVASCHDALASAAGALAVDIAVVDRNLYVDGLASADITRVDVSVEATSTSIGGSVRATLTDNVFLAALPFNDKSTGQITVTAVHRDGSTSTYMAPGIPAVQS